MGTPYAFAGIHEDILNDVTPELAIVGGRGSGKSTVCVTKEIRISKSSPGIIEFMFRFSQKDTETKLIPFYKEMLDHENEFPTWNDKENCFVFANGSMTYLFGLQTTSAAQRYEKIRGLKAARLYGDQSEAVPSDVGLELRASLRQQGFAHQLTFGANPPPESHWIARQFPVGVQHRYKNRKLYQLRIYDNPHIPAETLREMELAYPPEHPNYRTLMLGQYGMSVTGEPIYGQTFKRAQHVRPIGYNDKGLLLEAFDFGKLNPCWIVAQRPYSGGLHFLGGIIGQELYLVDFLPIVQEYRSLWFPALKREQVKTCCTLSASRQTGNLVMGVQELKAAGFSPVWTEGGNSPDTVLALIERQANYMRRRGADGAELFGVNNAEDRWLKVSREGVDPSPFMAYAYEGGYAWSEKTVSVGRNEVKQPQSDEWFEFCMRCAEAIELNFGRGATQEQRDISDRQSSKSKTYTPSTRWG